MKLFNFFKIKNKQNEDISGEQICRIYYLLRDYYDSKSPNICVLKNMKKFKWQVKIWAKKLNPTRGDRMIKVNDSVYRFILDEQEVNIIYVDSLHNIEEKCLKYKKYM